MSIPFTNYVNITSGVGAGTTVRQRNLIARIFTNSILLPPQSFREFNSPADVAAFFGSTSAEYLRAVKYFSFIGKLITAATKISFGRFVDTAVAPMIYGATAAQALGSWTAITAGAFGLTIGGVVNTFTALNFSGAANLSAVAAIIQTAVRTKTGAQWTGATVTYDAVAQRFVFVGGTTGAATISVQAGAGAADIAGLLGWLSATTVLSPGSGVETLTATMNSSENASNNFGSFTFIPTLTDPQVTELAQWNATKNVMYQFSIPAVSYSAASNYYTNLVGLAGAEVTYSPIATEYPELIPMVLLASTDYTKRSSVQNYMFQNGFDVTPSVTDGVNAAAFDLIRCNYYGQTQTAGQQLSFYQRGVMMGGPAAPVDMNVYANEQWLKDYAGSAIMTLLLALPKISANSEGRSKLLSCLQPVVDRALLNGTISVGKTLTTAQQLYVTTITGDDLAWRQVQGIGYWLDAVVVSYTNTNSLTEYKIVYTLIYSKDDDIRKVEGTHVLI